MSKEEEEEVETPTILDYVLSSDDEFVPWPVEEPPARVSATHNPKIKIILNGKKHARPTTPVPPSPSDSSSSSPLPPLQPRPPSNPPPLRRHSRTRSRTSRHRNRRRSNNRVHERIWPPSTFFDMINQHLHACKRNGYAFDELMREYDRMHNGYRCFEDMGAFTDWFGRERAKEFILLAIATNGTLRATFNQMRVGHNVDTISESTPRAYKYF